MTSEIQSSSPVATIKTFLACVERKDAVTMRNFIHPQATACLIREGEPRFQSLHAAIDTLEKAEEKLVETTWDELEHVDGEYATVWASWSMHRDGKVSSPFCLLAAAMAKTDLFLKLIQLGSSSYSLLRDSSRGWIILTMSDIARSPNETACV